MAEFPEQIQKEGSINNQGRGYGEFKDEKRNPKRLAKDRGHKGMRGLGFG